MKQPKMLLLGNFMFDFNTNASFLEQLSSVKNYSNSKIIFELRIIE